jgi:hypothetical protein
MAGLGRGTYLGIVRQNVRFGQHRVHLGILRGIGIGRAGGGWPYLSRWIRLYASDL